MEKDTLLQQALHGDIQAFHALFAAFKGELKSYLYRLLADRSDAEDLAHDAFVQGFDKISTFKGESSLKTWVFRIATHLAYDYLKRRKRWGPDAQDRAKAYAIASPDIQAAFLRVHQTSPAGSYEIREHIDFCFTCIGKTLPIEQQIALILMDLYDFSRREIALILDRTEGVVKHLLHDARHTMGHIFEQRCALINKNGVCHQCTELAGIFNPRQARREELLKLELVAQAEDADREKLYRLRRKLVRAIDPLSSPGSDLQDIIMQCTRVAAGEPGAEDFR